jgi:2-oxo-3-hexenedioate decarboxylase
MTISEELIIQLSERVEAAQADARPIRKLTDDYPGMTIADGYRIQSAVRRSLIGRGHRHIGWKAGLTSRAKMEQMGVDKPSIGFLTDRMLRPESSVVGLKGLIHPRVECEIAFVTNRELSGSSLTIEDVMAATAYVQPALEIIDSRFTGFKFDLESVIADNSSSALFIPGGRMRRPGALDLRTVGVVLELNGEIVELGAGAAVLAHPAAAIAMVVRVLDELGETLPAGSFVMSGAITSAIAVKAGDTVTARFYEMGGISVSFS